MSKTVQDSETAAMRWLRDRCAGFGEHRYADEEHGATGVSARERGVDAQSVVLTPVMEDETAAPPIVLMHGDCEVSTKALAREIGVKRIAPCNPAVAERHSGDRVGGTSPFGLRKPLPNHVEASVLALPTLWIRGGRRGGLVSIRPNVLADELAATPVRCALHEERSVAPAAFAVGRSSST